MSRIPTVPSPNLVFSAREERKKKIGLLLTKSCAAPSAIRATADVVPAAADPLWATLTRRTASLTICAPSSTMRAAVKGKKVWTFFSPSSHLSGCGMCKRKGGRKQKLTSTKINDNAVTPTAARLSKMLSTTLPSAPSEGVGNPTPTRQTPLISPRRSLSAVRLEFVIVSGSKALEGRLS